ncbi:growth hormone receptor binding protein [Rhizobiaceae bacterium n13]|uniref:Growth hormone receptor binding protein n=1 Tax=Ferirhizobium litorale TaxID=2927786 RepID=A0AAE3U5D0_9HYPH|nr:hypothetical protein [Fererhizobium litorale]MDI7862778.1 growth hormone receptor binding protein [Fererhizobium litorale]MDI7924358.1 growth hormone receptor binding protein [Fererhizobium litorale]
MPECAISSTSTSISRRRPQMRIRMLPIIFLAGLFGGTALAQQPTQAQQEAIRSACRSDFMAQCSGVTPGGKEALTCLQQHRASLSAACQQAVSAIGSVPKSSTTKTTPSTSEMPPAPATSGQAPAFSPRQELIIAREACGGDFRTYCRTVPLGGGRAIACLRENMSRLSPGCQKVLQSGL